MPTDLAARLAAAKNKATAQPKPPTETKAVTPEPTIEPFDASGTEVAPPEPIQVSPPDAAPNLTQETAPKPKRGRPPKVKAQPGFEVVTATTEFNGETVELTEVVATPLQEQLESALYTALKEKRFAVVRELATALISL